MKWERQMVLNSAWVMTSKRLVGWKWSKQNSLQYKHKGGQKTIFIWIETNHNLLQSLYIFWPSGCFSAIICSVQCLYEYLHTKSIQNMICSFVGKHESAVLVGSTEIRYTLKHLHHGYRQWKLHFSATSHKLHLLVWKWLLFVK